MWTIKAGKHFGTKGNLKLFTTDPYWKGTKLPRGFLEFFDSLSLDFLGVEV